jgi:hypothetical protein
MRRLENVINQIAASINQTMLAKQQLAKEEQKSQIQLQFSVRLEEF